MLNNPSPIGSTKIDVLRQIVGKYFTIYNISVTPVTVIFDITTTKQEVYDKFDQLRKELVPMNYIPFIEHHLGEYRIVVTEKRANNPWGSWVNLIFLIATIISTIYSGALIWGSYSGNPNIFMDILYGTLYFALPLMLILGVHEMGHYVTAKHYHVSASLPFFIPFIPPFGTMGAFISLRDPIPDRKSLMDIGIAGPLAGLCVALPVTILGLYFSAITPSHVTAVTPNTLLLGSSFFWNFITAIYPISASATINPMALAGWVGLFVTAINLIPAGQLDGGHIVRSLGGDAAKYISWSGIAVLLVIGFLYYPGWILFGLFVLLIGPTHPPPLNDITKLHWKRYILGGLAIFLLVSMFITVPLTQPTSSTLNYSVARYPLTNTIIVNGSQPIKIYLNVTNNYSLPYYVDLSLNATVNNSYNASFIKNVSLITFQNYTKNSTVKKNYWRSLQIELNRSQTVEFTLIISLPPGEFYSNFYISIGPAGFSPVTIDYTIFHK